MDTVKQTSSRDGVGWYSEYAIVAIQAEKADSLRLVVIGASYVSWESNSASPMSKQ